MNWLNWIVWPLDWIVFPNKEYGEKKKYYQKFLDWLLIAGFTIVGGALSLMFLPILIPLALFFGCIYTWIGIKIACVWLRDKTVLPLICTFAGGMMCMCGGKEGFFLGASFGFIFGVICSLVRYDGAQSYPKATWFGPYDDGIYAGQTQVYEPAKKVSPWSWKGFQVTMGPREDDIRKDIN